MKAFAGIGIAGLFGFFIGKAVYDKDQGQQNISRQKISVKSARSPTAKPQQAKAQLHPDFQIDVVKSNVETIVYNRFFIHYSNYTKSPLAVHEIIDLSTVNGKLPRPSFIPDPHLLKKFQVDPSYYKDTKAGGGLHLDQGHMASHANYNQIQKFVDDTIVYSNVVPQHRNLNRGIWKGFQTYCRNLLKEEKGVSKCDTVEIISGPIYSKDTPADPSQYEQNDGKPNNQIYKSKSLVLKQNGLLIPDKCYKIIKCNKGKESYYNGFVFNNVNPQKNKETATYAGFKRSIDQIELATGLKFNLKGSQTLINYDKEGLSKLTESASAKNSQSQSEGQSQSD